MSQKDGKIGVGDFRGLELDKNLFLMIGIVNFFRNFALNVGPSQTLSNSIGRQIDW